MRNLALLVLTSALSVVIWSSGWAVVFHGYDKDTGTRMSKTTVNTVTPPEGMRISFKFINAYGGQTALAFSSPDRKLKDLDTTTAFLLIDNQRIPIKFKGYHALVVKQGRPVVHELWFGPLDRETVERISTAKTMSITISTVSGIPIMRDFGEGALSDVKEVIEGTSRKE